MANIKLTTSDRPQPLLISHHSLMETFSFLINFKQDITHHFADGFFWEDFSGRI
jgi:hypothetical protein